MPCTCEVVCAYEFKVTVRRRRTETLTFSAATPVPAVIKLCRRLYRTRRVRVSPPTRRWVQVNKGCLVTTVRCPCNELAKIISTV